LGADILRGEGAGPGCQQDVGFGQPQRQTNPLTLTNAEKFNCNFLCAVPPHFFFVPLQCVEVPKRRDYQHGCTCNGCRNGTSSHGHMRTFSPNNGRAKMLAYDCRKGSTKRGDIIFENIYICRQFRIFKERQSSRRAMYRVISSLCQENEKKKFSNQEHLILIFLFNNRTLFFV